MTERPQRGSPTTSLLAAWLARSARNQTSSSAGGARLAEFSGTAGEVVGGASAAAGLTSAVAAALPPPGVEAVLDALSPAEPDPAQVTHALTVFAWERAVTGGDVASALAELDQLWDALESSGQAPICRDQARRQLADAWVDAVAAERGSPGVDPLSGLHTAGYLYGRVHELDRLAGEDPSALVLIVVRWAPQAGPWMRIARILQVASILRCRVRPEATLSQVGGTMAVALVPDDARSRLERISLTKDIEAGELSTADVRVDVFAVPDDRAGLPELVTRLHEEANLDHAARLPSFRHSGTGSLD